MPTVHDVFSSYESLVEKGGHKLSDTQKEAFTSALKDRLAGGVTRAEMAEVLHATNRAYQEETKSLGNTAPGYNTSDAEFNSFLGTDGYRQNEHTLFTADSVDKNGNVLIDDAVKITYMYRGAEVTVEVPSLSFPSNTGNNAPTSPQQDKPTAFRELGPIGIPSSQK